MAEREIAIGTMPIEQRIIEARDVERYYRTAADLARRESERHTRTADRWHRTLLQLERQQARLSPKD